MDINFYAQNLKNEGSDHYASGSRMLNSGNEKDKKEISKIVERIAPVRRKGKKLYSPNCYSETNQADVRLEYLDSSFVVQVFPNELDAANRRSAVLCYGEYCPEERAFLEQEIWQQLKKFVRDIGRTLPEGSEQEFIAALRQLSDEKKNSARSNTTDYAFRRIINYFSRNRPSFGDTLRAGSKKQ